MEPQFPAKFAAFVTPNRIEKKKPAPFPKDKSQAKKKDKKKERKPTLFELAKTSCENAGAPVNVAKAIAAEVRKQEAIGQVQASDSVQDLIHAMSDVIMIEKNNGISRCEVHLDMLRTDSPFKSGVLIVDHYDTAPHSFNIDFYVEQSVGQALFNDNIANLEGHLKAAFPLFEFNVAKAGFNAPTTLVHEHEKKKKKDKPIMAKTTNKASLSFDS